MPAVHERYQHRNKQLGAVAVYDISTVRPALARITVDDEPVEDGTRARVVEVYDFDFPYLYELEDGRRTRRGGIGWHHYSTNAEADAWHPRAVK